MFSSICALPSPKVALLCSAGSQVLRHSPTPPARARPPFGLWPSRTDLDPATKTYRRSPGSRACCSQRVRVLRLHRTEQPLAITRLPCCLPPLRNGVGILIHRLFEAQ